LDDALRLEAAAPSAPQLLLGALWSYTTQAAAEAVVDAWIVIEQIVGQYWEEYAGGLPTKRRNALRDHRAYTVAVRIEVLETTGKLPAALAIALHGARKQRNDLVHSAAGAETGRKAIEAMALLIEHYLGRAVTLPAPLAPLAW
jgi:hypothetical protein